MNPLIDKYDHQLLSHATLLEGSPALVEKTITELVAHITFNPADLLVFSYDETITIQDVRQIIRFTHQTRATSPIKLIGIPDVSKLSLEAANSLLKVLEEPPPFTHFILGSRLAESVLPTIRSRCHLIRLTKTDDNLTSSLIPLKILTSASLPERFDLAKELAASDTPLPVIIDSLITNLGNQLPKDAVTVLLTYRPLAQQNPNRRLFLENLLLELYNNKSS